MSKTISVADDELTPFKDIERAVAVANEYNMRAKQKLALREILTRYKSHKIGKEIMEIIGGDGSESGLTKDKLKPFRMAIWDEKKLVREQLAAMEEQHKPYLSPDKNGSTKFAMRFQQFKANIKQYLTFLNDCIDGLTYVEQNWFETGGE